MRHLIRRRRSQAGFTLAEILVAAVITVILVGILLKITTLTSTTINMSTQKLTAFASARAAFDIVTRNLSQATLNTYLDFYDASGYRRTQTSDSGGTFTPVTFGRASDLQFVVQKNAVLPNHGQEVYFQAPRSYSSDASLQSVQGLLNAIGYYVQFGPATNFEPVYIQTQEAAPTLRQPVNRYRLMQGMEPTENLQVFATTQLSAAGSAGDNSAGWLTNIKNGTTQNLGSVNVAPLADNVIAFVVWPRLSVNDDPNGTQLLPADHSFAYDSQLNPAPTGSAPPYTQSPTADVLPPDVQVTMVVIDEASAIRLQAQMTAANTPNIAPPTIENALAGKFLVADNYPADIQNLAKALNAAKPPVSFQIFNTTVALRESKWTIQQK